MRIADRFPNAGLRTIVGEFLQFARNSKSNIEWISTPNIPLRVFSYGMILAGVAGIIFSISFLDFENANTKFDNMITVVEATINELVLLGVAIFFLVSMELRYKRNRALKRLNELRSIAHVIDMHQLTKDPNYLRKDAISTQHSPKRLLTKFELQRYLDYCSEATALVAKIAALYSQSLPDTIVIGAVNEIEDLTTGISQKIWQKLVILNEIPESELKENQA